jgi:hypothetical protein
MKIYNVRISFEVILASENRSKILKKPLSKFLTFVEDCAQADDIEVSELEFIPEGYGPRTMARHISGEILDRDLVSFPKFDRLYFPERYTNER